MKIYVVKYFRPCGSLNESMSEYFLNMDKAIEHASKWEQLADQDEESDFHGYETRVRIIQTVD